MSYQEKIPGMRPDERNRNIAVGGGYLLLLFVILVNISIIVSILLFVVPVLAAILIGRNYKDSAEELSRVPGISATGGIVTGISAFIFSFVLMAVVATSVLAIAPLDTDDTNGDTDEATSDISDEEETEDAQADDDESEEADETDDDQMHTVTVSVADSDGEAIESADVEFVHDDAIIFNTRENVETDSDGIATFETESDSDVEITAEASGYEEADASLTISQDEEVPLTLEAVPEEPEETEEAAADDTEQADADETEQADADDSTASVDEEDVEEADTSGADEDEPEEAQEEFEEEESLSDGEVEVLFESLAAEEGIDIVTAETQNGTFVVEYTSFAQSEQQLAQEIGYVAGLYAGMIGEGHSSDRMEAAILNAEGETAGTFQVESDWGEAYSNDEISDEEFSQMVLNTFEGPPGQPSLAAEPVYATV